MDGVMDPYERGLTMTGQRVHWARAGQRYALCGAVVTELSQDDQGSSQLPECEPCARKHERLLGQ